MSDNTIICPKCATVINLDEEKSKRFSEDLKKNELKLKADFELQKKQLQKQLDEEREKDKEELRKKAIEWAEKKAEEKLKEKDLESKDLQEQVKEFKKKEKEMIDNELELRKKTRELEDKAKNQEIENLKKLDEERKKLEQTMKEQQSKKEEEMIKKIQEDQSKLLAEKDKQMEILKKSLDEATRKANQGSQQIQGEVQENELKEILTKNFPLDIIEDVPTGIKGADLIHTVRNERGQDIGVILWESKNTKAWSGDWIKKLKDDRIIAKADVCILISNTLPDNIKHFGLVQDVWVSEFAYFLALTVAVRDKLLSIHQVSKSLVGKEEKMEQLYSYLSSSEFKSKIENIIDAFKSMKEDLDSEKRSMARIWSKREKELERIINNTSFLYGDMQGIMGASLGKINYLELDSGEK